MDKSLVYSLILSILLVVAPHAEHLPLWVSILCAALLAWRTLLTYRASPLPPRWLLLLITLIGVAVIGKSYHTLFGRDVGVTLLMLLATLKLLELRSPRDAMAIIYLSCFIIITNFFYSQSIPTALLMLLSLIVIVASWLRIQAPNIRLRPQLRLASIMLIQSVPLMLVLFVLFPRVQGPLWGMPQDAYNSSGLSEEMSPGSLSKLSLSEAVAFRATYATATPARNQMYWRGPVLWQYDGRTWTRGATAFPYAPQFTATSAPLEYSVVLEPHNKRWLFALDVPAVLPPNSRLNSEFQLINNTTVTARMRYQMSSTLQYHANAEETPAQLQRGLQLPPRLNPRTLALAQVWRAQQSDPAELVKTALRYFNQENFSYTLEPPLLGRDGVDEFLFNTRQGFCEHYSSAFVYLMRAAGIPSRVVTGYQGGEFNSVGNYYIVRQSDAHAWAEVWIAERGWVRVDPTAAIAPERVEQNLASALKDNTALSFMARNPPAWLSKLRLNIDALSNSWNEWILGYDPERQFALLTRLGMEDVSWQRMARNLILGLAVILAVLAGVMFRHLFTRDPDRVHAAWLRLCKRMAKAGLPREAHEGALDYAQRVGSLRPALASELQDIAQRYVQLRYGVVPGDKQSVQAFIRSVARFKARKAR